MKLIHSFLLLLILVTLSPAQNGIQHVQEYPGTFRPVFDEFPSGSALKNYRPDKIDTITPSFAKDTLVIDFESRQVTFSRFDTLSGYPLWEFHYAEMGEYLKAMENHTKHALWEQNMIEKGKRKRDSDSLVFKLPAHLPAWATRILGKEPPQLSITGSQKIEIGAKRYKVSVNGQDDEVSNGNPQVIFKPTSNFLIKGTVGRLLKMEIRLSGNATEDEFLQSAGEQLSNIKIEYREDSIGELEDDIIQEVIIGRTGFNMPGQGLAGYSSGSNEGLFGVKVRSQIGPLALTTIASVEQLEKEKKTIKLGASENQINIGESGYRRNTYFFLDEIYRLKYLAQFIDPTPYEQHLASLGMTESPVIKSLRVYKRVGNKTIPENSSNEYRWAQYDFENTERAIDVFEYLVENEDYVYDQHKGRITFLNSIGDNDLIAIYMEDTSGTFIKGDLTTYEDTSLTKKIIAYKDLWVLKREKSDTKQSDAIYNLMMRNVYALSSSSATPDFKIKREVGGEVKERNEGGVLFSQILGLVDENENYRYQNDDIFDLSNGYVIFPPYTSSDDDTLYNDVAAMYPFSNPALGESKGEQNWGSVIYNDRSGQSWADRFQMVTINKERQTSFNLDFSIMPGTETLKDGDQKLIKGEDYSIDYTMGYVDLISERARSAEEIEAEYQKESLFFLESKVFMGINGKVDLPNIGRNSYFGTTFMWQLMDSKSLTPKVGTEPFDRFLFDANLELDFEPEWMTAFVNLLPVLATDATSSARFSFEVAHSKAKVSTKSDGEAYIDNFQTSARSYSLGEHQSSWKKASPDNSWVSPDSFIYHPPAWSSYWYQPTKGDGQIRKSQIYPLGKTAKGATEPDQIEQILRMVVQPYPSDSTLRDGIIDQNIGQSVVKPWAGIMRGFSGSLMDHREYRYLEFWMRHSGWKSGKEQTGELIVDLGLISENTSLDGKQPAYGKDYEYVGSGFSNEHDLGIDQLKDEDEVYYYPQLSEDELVWHPLEFSDSALGIYSSDPSRDNYRTYNADNNKNAPFVNGTEGNTISIEIADNKDVDGNGAVYPSQGAFFRYKIDLSNIESSPYLSTTEIANSPEEKWVKIRIPVGENANPSVMDSVIDEPSWSQINHVRILYHDMSPSAVNDPGYSDTLEFESIQFVGNLWREMVTDSFDIGHVTATIEESKKTSGYRRPPEKRVEKIDGTTDAPDYTLVLDFEGIYSDSSVFAYRDFSGHQSMDLTNYSSVRFWVEEMDDQITTSRGNWFVYRFGTNDSTFYEFKTRRLIDDDESISKNLGWNSDEGIEIDLMTFAELKNDWYDIYGERKSPIDTSYSDRNGNVYRIYSKTELMPSISDVQWIAFGIENQTGTDFDGRVRINGLRAAGVGGREGWAVRSAVDLQFADFLKSNVNYNYTDADFRSMGQNVHSKGNSSMSTGASGEMQISKFMPDRLGIRLPIGAQVSASLSRPEMRPNSDITLRNNGEADGFSDMVKDFARVIAGIEDSTADTESEKYQKMGKEYRIYTGYRKNNKSVDKIPVNLTADRFGVEYSYSVKDSTARNGFIPLSDTSKVSRKNSVYHIDEIHKHGHKFTLDYDLTPSSKAAKKMSWQPFKKSKNRSIPRKVKSMKLNLLPTKIDFDLINMNYSWEKRYNSEYEVRDSTYTFRPVENLGINHGFDFQYKPISPFTSMSFSVKSKRDFESYLKTWNNAGFAPFVTDGLFELNPYWRDFYFLNMENNRVHSSQFEFKPEFFKWLIPTARLTSNYTQNVDVVSDTSYLKGGLTSGFTFSTNLKTRHLFEQMGKWGKGKSGWSKSMKFIAKGLDKIDFENLNFDYNASMNVDASYMDSSYLNMSDRINGNAGRYYAYTLGLYNRSFTDIVTGNMDDRNSFGGVQNRINGQQGWDWNGNIRNNSDKRKTTQSVGGRTSFKLPNPIDFTFNQVSLRWKRDYEVTTKPEQFDTSYTWPEITVRASTPLLKKIPQAKANFRSLNMKTGYTYSKTTRRSSQYFVGENSNSQPIDQKDSYKWGLDPLFKVDGVLKKRKIDLGYSISLKWDTTFHAEEFFVDSVSLWTFEARDGNKTFTTDQKWTLGYKIPGKKGRTVKLFRSRVIELTGDTRIKANVALKKDRIRKYYFTQIDETTGESPKIDEWDEMSLNISPTLEYDFTKNIRFKFYYTLLNRLEGIEKRETHDGQLAGEIDITF